jgi:hypothetical protein
MFRMVCVWLLNYMHVSGGCHSGEGASAEMHFQKKNPLVFIIRDNSTTIFQDGPTCIFHTIDMESTKPTPLQTK